MHTRLIGSAAQALIFLTSIFSVLGQQPGTKKWEFNTGGLVNSSPAVGTDGTIYVGSNDGKFYAINANGSKKWEFTTGDDIDSTPAIGADSTSYIYSRDRNLYAINADGSQRWKFPAKVTGFSSPAIGPDGTLYLATDDGLIAINANGSEKWRFTTGGLVPSATVGANGSIYVGHTSGYLYSLAPNGAEQWKFKVEQFTKVSTAAILDSQGNIHFGSTSDIDAWLYVLSPTGAKIRQTLSNVRLPESIGKSDQHYAAEFGSFRSSFPNGDVKWSFAVELFFDFITTPAAVADDGTAYFGTQEGRLYAVDGNGKEKWQFITANPVYSWPAIGSDGTVYFGSGTKLYAVNGGSPLASAPWPMYRRDARHTAAAYLPPPPSISVNMYAGVTITGEIGKTYRIDYSRTADSPNWQPLSTITLDRTPYLFLDIESTNATKRFYRSVQLP